MRDQTADEVGARRRLEARLLEVFACWGYTEVATPTLEYLDTLLHGGGPGLGDRLLKLVDTGGEVLALRPEMTVPLARFAATRLLPAGRRPLRLAYVAGVFRGQERGSGRLREFTQAGVELIGDGGTNADVEVIALAGEALLAAGVERPSIGVGHAGFLRGILASLPPETAETARDLLYRRAFAELGSVVGPGPALEALRLLPALRGQAALGRAMSLAASDESRQALDALQAVVEGVASYDQPVRVEVNLGLIRDFDYYTGVVFEAHPSRAGMPLLGGGRYDGLLARFGAAAPATGFAIGVERVLEASVPGEGVRPVTAVTFGPGGYRAAVAAASLLRQQGLAAVVVPEAEDLSAAACAVAAGTDGFVVCTDGGWVHATAEGLTRVVRSALEAAGWRL
jgi:ATP phosphoribosyltransferase regulatory subunit